MADRSQIVRRDENSWLVDAQVELHDLERVLGAGGLATKSEFTTLAGLLLEHAKRIPLAGEVMMVNGWRLEGIDLDGNRIDKVLITPLSGRPGSGPKHR